MKNNQLAHNIGGAPEKVAQPLKLLKKPLLELRGVTKTFATDGGTVTALSNIDLQISPKEFLCIVGPSGCGKSTLLNMIAGLEGTDLGTMTINGEPIAGTGPDRLVIFQEAALFPWLTVAQNVEFGLKIKGMPKDQRKMRVDESLDLVGLTKFAKAYPHQLSGGMKQRTAIARGLVLDPQILLMDEPFAALDAQTRELLYEELQSIWARTGKTILFVTHNVREAACLADRIILMSPHPGKIYKEYHVDQPRPRVLENAKVMDIARTITTDLKAMPSHGNEHGEAV